MSENQIQVPNSIYEILTDAAKAYGIVIGQAAKLQKENEELKERIKVLEGELNKKGGK
jgi:hypothetical protein